jgi:beta-galactosidase
MFFNFKTSAFFIVVVLFCAFQTHARQSRYDVPFNLDWKFYKGTPTGTPQNLTYDDAAWPTVSVPHSASYDPPTVTGELAHYGTVQTPNVNYWYRKTFTCPVNARKVFIYFGAVMQSATVFVNGTQVGTHYNSGYTGFFFDISNNVARGSATCIAVHANINNDGNIPPGDFGNGSSGSGPDYLLFSGMYRDVQLFFKDSVYVPLRGQRTATTGSVASPTVHAVTSVRNDALAAKSVTVALTVRNAAGVSVATQTSTLSVPANNTVNFDMTTGVITSPALWSPSSPNLYSLLTKVSVGGAVVDSVVEQIGLRFYTWSGATPGGISVNGIRTELKGMCMAQFMGWIQNAVPNSRIAKQVAMIKAMGINSIRCSHYPRSDAFYRVCDSLGMMVFVEVPNWGYGNTYYNLPTFWTRMYACDSEMVLDAYNHPCIYAWSLFNEPTDHNLQPQFVHEDSVIKGIEVAAPAGRVTFIANANGEISGGQAKAHFLDIWGINYMTSIPNGVQPSTAPLLNTEEYGGATNWLRVFFRGNAMDQDTGNASEAYKESNQMHNEWTTSDKCAGAHFWCFMDYCSFVNKIGREGIVDRLYIPKNVYFMFRKNETGAATDYWRNGTATKIDLVADLTTLRADGSDVSQIVATLRNANNQCVQQNCSITFSASPGASVVALYPGDSAAKSSAGNPVTVQVEGGRAGILLRTNRTPGNIVVTATSSCGLPATTVNLTSIAVSEPIPTLSWETVSVSPFSYLQSGEALRLKTAYTGKGIAISFPSGAQKTVGIMDCRGKTVASFTLKNGIPALLGRSITGSGIFYAVWDDNGRQMLTRLTIVR